MKRLFFLACFLGMVPFIAEAQFFSVYDIDTKDYPVVRASYIYVNDNGEQVYHFDKKDVNIWEYEEQAKLLSLKKPQKSPPKKLSVVLTFDVSGSMTRDRLEIARAAGLRFVDLLPLEVSECAVSSFDHVNYLNCDFTHSEERLKEAIRSLKARGGTNYNSGFITSYSGAFQIAKEGRYKKVVVFLTDGLGEGDKSEILRQAKKYDVAVYPVTIGLEMPDILKDIATSSGGRYFGEVTDTSEAKDIYDQILLNAQSVEPGQITWRSPNGCHDNIETIFSYKNDTVKSSYRLRERQRIKLDVQPAFIQYETSDSLFSRDIQLTAVNSDFTIKDMILEGKKGFSLEDQPTTPFQIEKNSMNNIRLRYDPSVEDGAHTTIRIVNDQCPESYVYAKAGSGSNATSLELVTPNGGEVYSAGLKGNIKWRGIAERDSVFVYYSSDRGDTWQPVGWVDNLSDEWEIPAIKGSNNLIRIEQSRTGSEAGKIEPLLELSGSDFEAHNARFVGKGRYILSAGDNHSLNLWDAKTGRYMRSFRFHTDWVYDAVENPDGSRIVSASDDGSAMIFSLNGHKEQYRISTNYSGIHKAIFSEDGEEIITASDDGALRIWDVNTGQHKHGVLAHNGGVLDVDQHPEGNLLVSGGDDQAIRIWEFDKKTMGKGLHRSTFRGHTDWVTDVEFSPDGAMVLSASRDGTARLWNVHTGDMIYKLTQHNKAVYSAVFSPDGKRILTASRDGTVQLWDISDKQTVAMLKADEGTWYRRAYFGPNGDRIITISSEGNVKLWMVDDTEPFQKDVSDEPFQIVSPKPALKKTDFGSYITGHSVDTLISGFFSNPTIHPLRVNDVFIGGEDKREFSLVSGYQPFILSSGESKDIELNFSPRNTGSRRAYVGVVTPTDTIKASLLGEGMEKDYTIPLERLNFGNVNLHQKRDTSLTFIENNGSTSLVVNNFHIEGAGKSQFAMKNNFDDALVSPGASKTISLSFKPQLGGRSSAILTFRVNDHLHKIYLFGEGLAPREVQLEGKVLAQSDHRPLSATIQSYDLKSNRLLNEAKTGNDGRYRFTMNPERAYRIVADKKGYIPGSIHVDLTGNLTSDKVARNIYLSSIDPGSTVVLNNIFFEYAKARLTKVSRAELNRMSTFLEENPAVSIRISGHTDSIGTREDNSALSRQRAEAVRDYLLKTGIDPERITIKGYGETKPVADNDTEEGRRKNRRVEFTITDRSDSSQNQ